MYKAYFQTMQGKQPREIGKGDTFDSCKKDMKKSNFYGYILYLMENNLPSMSEYVYIKHPNGKIIFSIDVTAEVSV